MKTCPVCGKVYSEGAFCEDCGVMLIEEVQQPVNSPVSANKSAGNNSKIIIAVLAVLLVAALAVAGVFAYRSFSGKKDDDSVNSNVPAAEESYAETTEADVQQVEITPETTMPESTTRSIMVETSKDEAYASFNRFYKSYIYAINAYNGSYITDCTPQVRSDMVERFEINKKSLFDLKSIDFDESTVNAREVGGGVEYTFFVNCKTMLYNRVTYEQKSLNYSCWQVTVRYENGTYQVTEMIRDNDHIMSANLHTVYDSEELF